MCCCDSWCHIVHRTSTQCYGVNRAQKKILFKQINSDQCLKEKKNIFFKCFNICATLLLNFEGPFTLCIMRNGSRHDSFLKHSTPQCMVCVLWCAAMHCVLHFTVQCVGMPFMRNATTTQHT